LGSQLAYLERHYRDWPGGKSIVPGIAGDKAVSKDYLEATIVRMRAEYRAAGGGSTDLDRAVSTRGKAVGSQTTAARRGGIQGKIDDAAGGDVGIPLIIGSGAKGEHRTKAFLGAAIDGFTGESSINDVGQRVFVDKDKKSMTEAQILNKYGGEKVDQQLEKLKGLGKTDAQRQAHLKEAVKRTNNMTQAPIPGKSYDTRTFGGEKF
jgi:hypothetical protein